MKHPHLPQYFAIKRDENNPLWFEFVEWINKIQPLRFVTWEYIGIDKNGCHGSDVFDNFRPNPVTLITLEHWKQAIDKTEDMKEDILTAAENGMFGGIKTVKETELQSVLAPEFDPSKPFEVSHDGEYWHTAPHYIGLTSKGKHLVEINDHGTVGTWKHIRNIEPFHAGILEVGEWIEITAIGPYEGWIAQKMQSGCLYCPEYAEVISKDNLKGRRVKVNITTEEI